MENKNKDNLFKKVFITRTNGDLNVFPKWDLWQQVSDYFNGVFTVNHSECSTLEILNLVIPYKNREIRITESDTRPMRFEIIFDSLADYELIIGWEDAIDVIMEKPGMEEIEIGKPGFDKQYLVKSNNAGLTINFFSDQIVDYLLKHHVYSISFTTYSKRNTANLLSVISRHVNDKEAMTEIILLHMRMIDKLGELKIIKI